MIRLALVLLAVALPTSAAIAQVDASIIPDDAPDWLPMEEAIADAQATGKIVLAYGYASWCSYCARFDQEVFTDDDVQAYLAEHYAPVRLDLESETVVAFFDATVTMAELGAAMQITATPTSVFVDTDGSLITKLPGLADPETYLLALRYVREKAYETTAFDEFLDANRAPAEGDGQ